MYGIMSGLEPRGYADGDLVQKALQLGVQPFGMSDEEIMQAISQKQQVDEISSGGNQGVNFTDQQFKDNFFDYTDPLEYATLPLVSLRAAKLAGKAGKGIYNAVRGPADQFGGKISQNLRGIGAYIGVDELARRGIPEIGIPGYENPFGKDAQDEAAEDLAEMQDNEFIDFEEDGGISLIDPDKPMEKGMSPKDIAAEIEDKTTPFDEMKGIKAFAKFASQLGATPGEAEEMTGGEFIPMRPFEAPGVMRMADGGIAVPGFKKGIAAFIKNKGKEVLKNRRKKKADKAEAKAASQEPSTSTALVPYERADSYIPREFAYLGMKGKEIGRKLQDVFSKKENQARAAIYGGIPLAGVGLGALLSDDKPPPPPPKIATGGGDKDVLDGESLKDIHYARSMARAQEAGRDRPTFVDYVASFPGSYTDKLGKDPEFAKQMMAGFVAMMTPTEGFVERNAIADFGGAVLKEQARQEGEVPDQIKLMQAIQESPELLAAYRKFSAGAIDPKDYNAVAASLMAIAQETVGAQPSVNRVIKSKERLVKLDNTPVTTAELVAIYEKDGRAGVIEFAKTLTPEEG